MCSLTFGDQLATDDYNSDVRASPCDKSPLTTRAIVGDLPTCVLSGLADLLAKPGDRTQSSGATGSGVGPADGSDTVVGILAGRVRPFLPRKRHENDGR